jgi:hypothetical protein
LIDKTNKQSPAQPAGFFIYKFYFIIMSELQTSEKLKTCTQIQNLRSILQAQLGFEGTQRTLSPSTNICVYHYSSNDNGCNSCEINSLQIVDKTAIKDARVVGQCYSIAARSFNIF